IILRSLTPSPVYANVYLGRCCRKLEPSVVVRGGDIPVARLVLVGRGSRSRILGICGTTVDNTADILGPFVKIVIHLILQTKRKGTVGTGIVAVNGNIVDAARN